MDNDHMTAAARHLFGEHCDHQSLQGENLKSCQGFANAAAAAPHVGLADIEAIIRAVCQTGAFQTLCALVGTQAKTSAYAGAPKTREEKMMDKTHEGADDTNVDVRPSLEPEKPPHQVPTPKLDTKELDKLAGHNPDHNAPNSQKTIKPDENADPQHPQEIQPPHGSAG